MITSRCSGNEPALLAGQRVRRKSSLPLKDETKIKSLRKPLRFVTSHSRVTRVSRSPLRKTKRLRSLHYEHMSTKNERDMLGFCATSEFNFRVKKSQFNLLLRVASERTLRLRLLSANWSKAGGSQQRRMTAKCQVKRV